MVCAELQYIFNDSQNEASLIEGSCCTKNTCDFITFVTKIVALNHTLLKKTTLKYECASQH